MVATTLLFINSNFETHVYYKSGSYFYAAFISNCSSVSVIAFSGVSTRLAQILGGNIQITVLLETPKLSPLLGSVNTRQGATQRGNFIEVEHQGRKLRL